MSEIPSLNYKSIYFFLLSFNAILFILSITDVISINDPNSLLWGSFYNIVISLFAWLGNVIAYHLLLSNSLSSDEDYQTYRELKIVIFFFAICLTSIVMFLVLIRQ